MPQTKANYESISKDEIEKSCLILISNIFNVEASGISREMILGEGYLDAGGGNDTEFALEDLSHYIVTSSERSTLKKLANGDITIKTAGDFIDYIYMQYKKNPKRVYNKIIKESNKNPQNKRPIVAISILLAPVIFYILCIYLILNHT